MRFISRRLLNCMENSDYTKPIEYPDFVWSGTTSLANFASLRLDHKEHKAMGHKCYLSRPCSELVDWGLLGERKAMALIHILP